MSEKKSSDKGKVSLVKEEIRLDLIFSILYRHKKKYILPVLLTAVLTALFVLCIPRYYTSTVMLAPEYNNPTSKLGGLGSMASSLGFDVGNASSQDALAPNFYPDLMKSTVFLVPLLDVRVETVDSMFAGTYMEFLTNHQKSPFWAEWLASLGSSSEAPPIKKEKINPYRPSKSEDALLRAVAGSILCTVDKKTDVITITTSSQDPLVAALLADTIKQHLQEFITDYRTQKAREDLQYVEQLQAKAEADFLKAQKACTDFGDTHSDLTLKSVIVEQEHLENEMQKAYNNLTALQQRRQVAEAKVLERTPAFTTIQNATVAVRPAGPKRMMIMVVMTLLSVVLTTTVLLIRYSHRPS